MSVKNIIAHPFRQVYGGLKRNYQLHARSKQLSFYYDIAKRLARASGLPKFLQIEGNKVRTYMAIGQRLQIAAKAKGVSLQNASLAGLTENITAAIEASWPKDMPLPPLEKEKLAALRVTAPETRESLKQRFKRNWYDTFVPIKSARALSVLVDNELGQTRSVASLESKLAQMEGERDRLIKQAQDKVRYLELGHQAYLEIMNAIYRSGSGKGLEQNIIEMFDVVTKWAYQVIGRSPDSEAAGWVVVGPDGRVGVPYKYVLAQQGQELADAHIFTLSRSGSIRGLSLTLAESQTVDKVADERGRFIALEEWENIKLREDLVIVEDKGERKLYRRNLRPGSQLVKHLARGKVGGDVGKLVGSFAGAVTELVGKFKVLDNAFVEMEEVDINSVELTNGEIIPYVQAGTIIKLVSAGSNNPDLREEKINKGIGVEDACRKGGLDVGIVSQRLEAAIGNVRTSALKPLSYMIQDVDNFNLRPQNRFLISIVGVASYYIRSLMEFNERGEAVCLGCLEVTNPEIIPEKLSAEEEQRLVGQFETGKIFADLASTGIMIKVLQGEINNLTEAYLGPEIYRVMKNRDFSKLEGETIDDASIMFADVAGFTRLSDILKDQPKKIVELLSRLFSYLEPVIVKHGGMVDKHIGDCIMANFGVPNRKTGDVEASVTTAIELQREIQKINLKPEMRAMYSENNLEPLGMTIGVNTGMVIAGNVGHQAIKVEYTVLSDAVNRAARLQSAVQRGHILIGERTFQQLSEIHRRRLVKEFNDYNRDIETIKEFILEEYMREGRTIDEEEIDRALEHYLTSYQKIREEDMFVPSVIWAKNKGALPCYFVRWDRHAYRYQFLKEAGIELSDKATFENQPLTIAETNAAIAAEPDLEKKQAMRQVFDNLLGKS